MDKGGGAVGRCSAREGGSPSRVLEHHPVLHSARRVLERGGEEAIRRKDATESCG